VVVLLLFTLPLLWHGLIELAFRNLKAIKTQVMTSGEPSKASFPSELVEPLAKFDKALKT